MEVLSVADFDGQGSIGGVYPNPSNGNFQIPINSKYGGEGTLTLYDIAGKKLDSQAIDLLAGNGTYSYSSTSLKAGIYVLFIQTPEGSIAQRVVID
ncbi:T9SS type A sorting domain-containing protein [Aequorivita echinoideorum]|uniref:T9SS type A sorting domain-containing protein n=1 Tax=Aequorivita echinoideorum TaxID=1549647 RepID=A0ABS5S2G8_9FLAO|nr:T9SS type A sorting domain-containing protein [Aequorivita echinoideorum]MBT0607376.1 T9SS type A sorting domain-containing protein [Aequorivita echinoideorum]